MRENGVKVAVVGYGAIAEKHLEVFRALGADVCASCNRSEEKRRKAEGEGGIPRTYADPLEMVERERPDALLLTANVLSLHGLAERLIPVGLPILLEKPPGISPEETQSLTRLAADHKTPVMVGLNRRFYSVYHRGLEQVGGREAVTGVSVEWSEDPMKMLQLGHPAEMLPLLNYANSLHGIDLLPFFAGEIPEPTAWGRDLDPTGGKFRWQMALSGVASRGARVHFESNWDVPGRWRLVVDAPDARMVSAPLETVTLLRRGKPAEEVAPSEEDRRFKPGFFGQASYFLEVVRDRRPIGWPACALGEAAHSMALASALTRACRQH